MAEMLLSGGEIAKAYGLTERQVKDYRQRGVFPCYELGPHTFRFRPSEIEVALQKLRRKAIGDRRRGR